LIQVDVATPDDLAGLEAEWAALWSRCAGATPFQRPEWLLPWYEQLAHGGGVALLARDGDALVGLAPLHRWDEGGLRRVGLAGGPVSDYRDALADDRCRAEVAAALAAGLPSLAEAAVLDDLPPCAVLSGPGAEPAQRCPELSLAQPWEAGAPRLARNVRHERRRLARAGEVAFARADAAGAPGVLAAMFRLHEARFGAPVAGPVQRFHRAAAPRLLAGGLLRLHSLLVNGAVGAVAHVLVAGGRAHLYQLVHDPALAPRSPGTVLCAHAIEEARAEGCDVFDFLRGDEPYKYAFGATDRVTTRRRLG
jgi:CelD/BcsL family acetyltransferase involved in cellulose biosynthesis